MNLKEIEKSVKKLLPKEAEIVKIDIEGPDIVIYTKNYKLFVEDETLIKKLATELKKKFLVRADSSGLVDPETAKKIIEEVVPEDAGITNIFFNKEFNEVWIEAMKVGLVIGKGGETLKEIVARTGWAVKILRAPTKPSEIIKQVRTTLAEEGRKRILKKVGGRIYRVLDKKIEWARITCLGAGREVGRSCFLLETPETKVLLDCGVNISSTGDFPYLHALGITLDQIDAVVITHAHLDHCGFLPFLFQYGYDGPVYCTPPTRDLMALLQKDYVEIAKRANETIYSEKDIKTMLKHTIVRGYGEVTNISPDIRLTFHNAGHILGSSIAHLHIGEGLHNLVYTGDIKFGPTSLFDPAETNFPRVETLIIESTYGSKEDVIPPRQQAEKELYNTIKEVLMKGGTVLVPVFAIGRAQEVMITLEKFAKDDKDWNFNVYLDGMIKESSAIHTVYPEYLKKSLQKRILSNDSPFDSEIFKMANPKNRKTIVEEGGNLILSPSGMLNGGPSVEYFKYLCEDPNNMVIFVGYQAEGSLGKRVQSGLQEVILEDEGKPKLYKINAQIKTIEGFSGHSDYRQLLAYVNKLSVKPKKILCVHGEEKKCLNLSNVLRNLHKVETYAPNNLDSIRLK